MLLFSHGAISSSSSAAPVGGSGPYTLPSTANQPVFWVTSESGITEDASGISSVADISPTGAIASRAAGESGPTLEANQVGGKPVIYFVNSDSYMMLDQSISVGNPFWLFLVARTVANGTGYWLAGNTAHARLQATSINLNADSATGGSHTLSPSYYSNSAYRVWEWACYDNGNASNDLFYLASGDQVYQNANFSNSSFTFNKLFSNFTGGIRIASALAYPGLSAGEAAQVRQTLATYYGIAL